MALLLFVVFTLFAWPLALTVAGVAFAPRRTGTAAVVAFGVQSLLAAVFLVMYSTLPGDHFYSDRSVCRDPSHAQSTAMRVLFLACVAVAGVAGFLVTSSSWPAGAKLAAVLGSAAVAGIVLLTMAKLVLCDPT